MNRQHYDDNKTVQSAKNHYKSSNLQ